MLHSHEVILVEKLRLHIGNIDFFAIDNAHNFNSHAKDNEETI